MILLMKDHLNLDLRVHSITGLEVSEEMFGGEAHILFAHGARAKRISYSTSHSETLAAISGLETASLVALRLAELLSPIKKPSLQQLAALQEAGVPFLPVDAMTDCKDLYSLTTGRTALPQDKSQRVYILAHREARLCGRLRWIILVPTQSMVADDESSTTASTIDWPGDLSKRRWTSFGSTTATSCHRLHGGRLGGR